MKSYVIDPKMFVRLLGSDRFDIQLPEISLCLTSYGRGDELVSIYNYPSDPAVFVASFPKSEFISLASDPFPNGSNWRSSKSVNGISFQAHKGDNLESNAIKVDRIELNNSKN